MRHCLCIIIGITIMLPAPAALAIGESWFQHTPPSDEVVQQEKLKVACLKEAEKANGNTSMWTHLKHRLSPVYDPQVESMKHLCRKMTAAYLSHNTEEHILLAQKCSDQIAEESKKGPKNSEHFQNLQQICEKMTGENVIIQK